MERTSSRAEFFDQTVGAVLRDTRARQRLDLEAVARSLRLPAKTLHALEEGDFSSLPADVYARGFLRQYAEALGLDPIPLLRMFTAERARFPSRKVTFPWASRPSSGRRSFWEFVTPRSLILAGGILGLLLVLLYVLFQVHTYTRPPRLDILAPAHDADIRVSTVTVQGRTDPTAEVLINGERTVVSDGGLFEETLRLSEGVNTVRFTARSVGGRETVVTRDLLVQSGAALPPTPSPAVRGSGPFAFTVRADGEPVWVSLVVDGQVAYAGLLAAEAEYTVRGTQVSITSGRAARTQIRIDGDDRGVLGSLPGVLRDVLFTRNAETGTVERNQQSFSSPSPPS